MPRIEIALTENWLFWLGEEKQGEGRQVRLPHDWAIEAPINRYMDEGLAQGFRDRWGIGWYEKAFMLDEKDADRCYFLDFGGIYENSTIWLNGTEVGGQKYGYTPFRLDVTECIRPGSNRLEVRVDNTCSPVDRWYSGCGIYRPVKLIAMAKRHFDEGNVVVQTRLEGKDAHIRVQTGVQGEVRAEISDGEATFAVVGSGELTLRVQNARLWSAHTPHLYQLTLALREDGKEIDRIAMPIGLREVTIDAKRGMVVNGEPVKLQGVCLHQDVGCRGIASKPEIWHERLLVLKEMGCNALRPSHHMFSSDFLDLCDELGFYVYEEPFDKWTGGLYGRYFEDDWKKDLSAMVRRDRNRPSVVMWGVGNEVENQGQASMLDILAKLVAHVKSLDDSRPVCYAMNPHFKRERSVDMSAIKDIQQFVDEVDDAEITDTTARVERIAGIAQHVDVICCNYQEQWYGAIHARCPDKPILGTEVYQYFSGHENQMKNMTAEMPSLVPNAHDYVIGCMLWTGIDYLGESMTWPAKGWSGAPIRTNRERKPGFYIFQSQWTKEPMVHFSVMDYSLLDEGVKDHWDMPPLADHWHFPQFHLGVIPYQVATNCEEVRLWLNGDQYHLPKPKDCPNGLITGFLPWKAGAVRVEGYVSGTLACTHSLVTPGPAVKLSFDQETVSVPAEPGHEILLTVRAVDQEGNPCFRESALIRFQVEGDAEIVGVDNGSLMHDEPYHASAVHLFRGVASVQVRLGAQCTRFVVSAYVEGMHCGRIAVLPQGNTNEGGYCRD